jgi:hypothetical protein
MRTHFLSPDVTEQTSSLTLNNQPHNILPSTEQLLITGGDARTSLDPFSGQNKYGCQPFPDPDLVAFASSTASIISTPGFAAANSLRQRLHFNMQTESQEVIYEREIQRIRSELLQLCDISDIRGLEVIFSPSGTDLHMIAAQYAASGELIPALAVMVDSDETGSGVAAALASHHSSTDGSKNTTVAADISITGNSLIEVVSVPVRFADGTPRQQDDIDAEVEVLVTEAVALKRRVLLILVDQSKTGLISPSPTCVAKLSHRLTDSIDVVVDACQFRIAPSTLRAYLEQGFMVALTGSKFVTGPSFSAVMLVPSVAAKRLQKRVLPNALTSCTYRENWPQNWRSANMVGSVKDYGVSSFGLLLRWEVALKELRRFRAVPEAEIINFLKKFAHAVRHYLASNQLFEPLHVPQLNRHPLIEANSWDHLQTIFPFLLYHPATDSGRMPLCREETTQVYKWLQVDLAENPAFNFGESTHDVASMRCLFGQPVACGVRDGIKVSALRICASSRLIVEATSNDGKGFDVVIADALSSLNKAALLVSSGLGNR